MKRIVQAAIQEGLVGSGLVTRIRDEIAALNLPVADSEKLQELIESEILNLHEGNIARYGLRPGEFERWRRHSG